MKGRNSSVISIRLSDEDFGIIKDRADRKGLSVSAFVKANLEAFAHSVNTNKPTPVVPEPASVNTTTGELPRTSFPVGKLPPIPGLIIEGNRIVGSTRHTTLPVEAKEEAPIYNPAVHKPGDIVRVLRNGAYITMTVPEMDDDGHAIP